MVRKFSPVPPIPTLQYHQQTTTNGSVTSLNLRPPHLILLSTIARSLVLAQPLARHASTPPVTRRIVAASIVCAQGRLRSKPPCDGEQTFATAVTADLNYHRKAACVHFAPHVLDLTTSHSSPHHTITYRHPSYISPPTLYITTFHTIHYHQPSHISQPTFHTIHYHHPCYISPPTL